MKPKTIIVIMIIFAIIAIVFAVFEFVYISSNTNIPDWLKFLILTR